MKMQNSVIFVKEKLKLHMKDKKYGKVRDYCHFTGEHKGAAYSICNLKYSVSKKISIVFHNIPNYHFIIKELAEEFKKQFNCLGKNTEKYITFAVLIEKEVMRINENGEEVTKNISYILQLIDSTQFMTSSLTNHVNNLSDGIHRIKCKFGHDDKKCKTCRIKYKYCDCFLEYTNFKDDLIEYNCLCYNKSYQQEFDEKSKERFFNTYKFFSYDDNKFILLLKIGVYPYEYLDDWEKFNQTLLT